MMVTAFKKPDVIWGDDRPYPRVTFRLIGDMRSRPADVVDKTTLGDPLVKLRPCHAHVDVALAVMEIEGNYRFHYGLAMPKDGRLDMAHIFFHPNPNGYSEAEYSEFGGKWADLHTRYIERLAPQVANLTRRPLIVPYMWPAHNARNPIFVDPGRTISMLLDSYHMALSGTKNQWLPTVRPLEAVGVSSYSAGVNFLANFVNGAAAAKIRILEAIDLDSPYMLNKPRSIDRSKVGRVVTITQAPIHVTMPTDFYIPPSKWGLPNTKAGGDATHGKIATHTLFLALETSPMR